MGNTINKEAEFKWLCGYVEQSCFDEELCRDRLRMLWTTYCLHHNTYVDTLVYEMELLDVWGLLEKTGDGTSEWGDYEEFSRFMSKYLH